MITSPVPKKTSAIGPSGKASPVRSRLRTVGLWGLTVGVIGLAGVLIVRGEAAYLIPLVLTLVALTTLLRFLADPPGNRAVEPASTTDEEADALMYLPGPKEDNEAA